jgi:PadR family transcriptional regulator, regulatory protein PadR
MLLNMAPSTILGEFELVVLLTMLQLGEPAYPLQLRDAIQAKAGRQASRATVFITLERLEQKGLVSSAYGDPTPVRGGRPKRFFKVERAGLAAARRSVRTVTNLSAGLESLLGAR